MLLSFPQLIRPQLERQLGHLVLCVSPQISRSSGHQGSEIPEAEAGAKFRNQRGCNRLLFKILFLMRFNLDNRVKSSKVTLCSHLVLNIFVMCKVWWMLPNTSCSSRSPHALCCSRSHWLHHPGGIRLHSSGMWRRTPSITSIYSGHNDGPLPRVNLCSPLLWYCTL